MFLLPLAKARVITGMLITTPWVTSIIQHKPRRTVLGLKIEALPDDRHSKPKRLYWELAVLNNTERRRLLAHTLELEIWRGNTLVTRASRHPSDTNRHLRLFEGGMPQVKEALGISERIGDRRANVAFECSRPAVA